jgi:Dopey, N-terminal
MLYDTHYFAIQQSLRPITKAFILALLPGLEEENGEFFDQVCPISNLLLCQYLTVP